MRTLELLAPAKNADIGIAAVDCGADAVYIAGPSFGARRSASNSVEDIGRLCRYAHRFGVRIYATVNTIVYEDEIESVRALTRELYDAGVDALIVQDPAVLSLAPKEFAFHASTQCAIRTPSHARFLESLGYSRLVLERQLSLKEIEAVRSSVDAELECFVHGALCVCYSGQCYLSEYLTGRSANRGDCAQACRSLYDLKDASGRVLLKNKAVLSLKDLNLSAQVSRLAGAGVCSFKIEGRLKGESYVKNTVRAYSMALDSFIAAHPGEYCRASYGRVTGGFRPDLSKSFNRSFTELYLDGEKGSWACMDAPKSIGEFIGTVTAVTSGAVTVSPLPGVVFSNGDGFSYIAPGGSIEGFRAGTVRGNILEAERAAVLPRLGTKLYRSHNAAFEKAVDSQTGRREFRVSLEVSFRAPLNPEDPGSRVMEVSAISEDGRRVTREVSVTGDAAQNLERLCDVIRSQLSKNSGAYSFDVSSMAPVPEGFPFMSAAFLNGIRRDIAARLDTVPVNMRPLRHHTADASVPSPQTLSYKANVANSISRDMYASLGAASIDRAYELSHQEGAELMRSRYCVRNELGLCPRQRKDQTPAPLFLHNGGRILRLDFHCGPCEMTVSASK